MTNLKTMYKGKANSPETYLKDKIVAEGTIFYLMDGSVLGDLPTLAVIGKDQNAETVLVKAKQSDGGYVIQRGIEGLPRAWDKNTEVARNFTNYDYQQLVDNIGILNKNKVDKVSGKGLSTKDYTAAEQTKLKGIEEKATKTEIINDLTTGGVDKALSAEQGKELKRQIDTKAKELKTSIDSKVETVEGKGLSTNDFTDTIKNKVDKIEDEANKTTIVNDLVTGGIDKALSAEQGKVLFQSVDNGKTQIANAIIDKGQSGVSNSSSFQELATKIKSIKTGYGVGDIIKPADVKVLSRTEEKTSKVWELTWNTNYPTTVAVDSHDYVYSGDWDYKVMKISPTGSKVWELIACNNLIKGIVADTQGYIYAADYSGYVAKISPTGQPVWKNRLTSLIQSITIDSQGYVYIGDEGKKVMKISPQGKKVWEFIGTDQIRAVAIDSQGYVYSGGFDEKITKLSPSGTKVWEFLKGSNIYSIAVDDKGYIYTADSNNKITKISPQRKIVWESTKIKYLNVVAVDSQGYVYADGGSNSVMKISPQGKKVWEFTGHTSSITSIAIDSQDNIYSSSYDKKIIKLHQNIETVLTGYEVLR